MIDLCLQVLNNRSRYKDVQIRRCQCEKGHIGNHDEYPFIRELATSYPSVAKKIIRDSTMTTGASWKSDDAGPNRILRWVMLLPDNELTKFGIKMENLKPQVVAKLREKAATYEDCMEVAKKLTWSLYQMADAPKPNSSNPCLFRGILWNHGNKQYDMLDMPCSTII